MRRLRPYRRTISYSSRLVVRSPRGCHVPASSQGPPPTCFLGLLGGISRSCSAIRTPIQVGSESRESPRNMQLIDQDLRSLVLGRIPEGIALVRGEGKGGGGGGGGGGSTYLGIDGL